QLRRTVMPGEQGPLFWGDYEPKRFSVADLEHLPSDLPSGPVLYELHHGRLITLPPHGDQHGAVLSNISGELCLQAQERGLGKTRTRGPALILGREPAHVFVPDAVFIPNRQLPTRRSPEGYLETIPDLIVEVRSKNDTLVGLQRKAGDYLN